MTRRGETYSAVHGGRTIELGDGAGHGSRALRVPVSVEVMVHGVLAVGWGATSATLVVHESCAVAIVDIVALVADVVVVSSTWGSTVAKRLLWGVSCVVTTRGDG